MVWGEGGEGGLGERMGALSVTHHKLGAAPSCFYKERITMPKTASTLAATPSTPQTRISKTPVAVQSISIPKTSSLMESTQATMTVLDWTDGLNHQNSELKN